MADIFAEIDVREVERLAREAPKIIAKHWRKGFRNVGGHFDNVFMSARFAGRPGIHTRTGRLAGSFHVAVTGKAFDDLKMAYGTTSRYARMQEHGGTVTAKGRMLAIPLGPAKTPSGISRGGPRTYGSSLFLIRSKKGNLLLVRSVGARKAKKTGHSFEPMFVLKRSVTIPARMGLVKEWNDRAPGIVLKHLKAATLAATAEAAKTAARR